jgi:hypothetical protein
MHPYVSQAIAAERAADAVRIANKLYLVDATDAIYLNA